MEQKREELADIKKFIDLYAVPEMIIKLRQGVGRLIRSESDTGVISILDVRATDRYKSVIDKVMAKYPQVDSIEQIEAFLKAVKPAEYFE